jgi:hypothetical protein
MNECAYRYEFGTDVPMEEVKASILLAVLGCESLHGETEVHLNAVYTLDHKQRACVIDVSSEVGKDLNRLFAGFVRREFGRSRFQVRRLDTKVGISKDQTHRDN